MSDAQPRCGKFESVLRLVLLLLAIAASVAAWAATVEAQTEPLPAASAPPAVFASPAASGSPLAPVPFFLTPPPAYTQPPTEPPSPGAASPPVAAPSPAPSTPATPAPGSTQSPYRFVYTPAPGAVDTASDAPSIIEIDLTDKILRAPGPLNIRVVTSAPVSKVTLHVLGRDLSLPKTGDGLFSVDNQLPAVPFWLRGKTYQVDFIAAVPDGRSVKVTIPVTLR
jgi:hypothetical protein